MYFTQTDSEPVLLFNRTKFGKGAAEDLIRSIPPRLTRVINRYGVMVKDYEQLKKGDVVYFSSSGSKVKQHTNYYGQPSARTNELTTAKVQERASGLMVWLPTFNLSINAGIDGNSPEEWILFMWDRAGVENQMEPGLEEEVAKHTKVLGAIDIIDAVALWSSGAIVPVPYKQGLESSFPMETPESETTPSFEKFPVDLEDVIDMFISAANQSFETAKVLPPEEEHKMFLTKAGLTTWYLEMLPEPEKTAALERYREFENNMMQGMQKSYEADSKRSGGWTGD